MKAIFFDRKVADFRGDAIVRMSFSDEKLEVKSPFVAYCKASKKQRSAGDFFAMLGASGEPVSWNILVGLGKKEELSALGLKQAIIGMMGALEKKGVKKALLILPEETAQFATNVVEAAYMGAYRFDKYKTADAQAGEMKISFAWPTAPKSLRLEGAVELGAILGSCTDLARDLANEPSNILYPAIFADHARKELAGIQNVSLRALNEAEIKKQGLGLLSAVGQGSVHPPRLVLAEYRGGKKTDKWSAFIGKGITFDSGGISLKTGEAAYLMSHMRRDMAGAACVLGAVKAIALMKLPINVVGVMSMAENMPDGGSHKPGDILTSYSGKTVEIYHTDAEGRLVVADGMSYAQKNYKVHEMIDVATLTGEVARVFGPLLTAVFANSDALFTKIDQSGARSGEPVWRMPLFAQYEDKVKGAFADLRELNFEMPNAIASALFLKQFVEKDVEWAHMDIAGSEEYAISGAGKASTGVGVRLLVHALMK